MILAITNQGLVRFSFFDGAIGAVRFIVFLQERIQDAQRKVFLMVDNLMVWANCQAAAALLDKARACMKRIAAIPDRVRSCSINPAIK